MSHSYIYIIASKKNGTLYVGVTNDIIRRIWEHKNKLIPGFTSKYSINKLVYYEIYDDISYAIHREKRLKEWPRKWKLNLIERSNPKWMDLYDELCD